MIGRDLGKCRIESLIGAGAMGMVYRAQHLTLGVPVALKMIRPELVKTPELLERFVREAQLMARLRHPNVARVFDVGHEGDHHFIVMELLEGVTLLNYVAGEAPLALKTFYGIFQPLSVGLAAAHELGIVHRDIKPENVILTQGLKPVITDFGIAAPPAQDSRLTQPGDVIGTPAYISPEQVMGDPNVDGRSDVFSLGMMMFEALTGRLPQNYGESTAQMVRRVNEDMPSVCAVNESVPEPLAMVVDRALSREVNSRWGSAEDLSRALRDATVPLLSLSIPTNGGAKTSGVPKQLGRRLRIPRVDTQVIADGVDLRFSDFHALLCAVEASPTGFGAMVLHYPDCSDLMLFSDGQGKSAHRLADDRNEEITFAEVLAKNAAAERGVIDGFALSSSYYRALATTMAGTPTISGLRGGFVDIVKLISHLTSAGRHGVLRLEHNGSLGLILVQEGKPPRLLCDSWIGASEAGGGRDDLAALVAAVQERPDTRIDYCDDNDLAMATGELAAVDPPLDGGELRTVVGFLAEAFQATGTALEKHFGLGTRPVLEKHLRYAAEIQPSLLSGLTLDADLAIDRAELLERVNGMARTGQRGRVISAIRTLLEGRVEAITETLGDSTRKKAKVIGELNGVWERAYPLLENKQLAEPFNEIFAELA